MRVDVNDYVILYHDDKPVLALVTAIKSNNVKGVLENKHRPIKELNDHVIFEMSDIVYNLGQDPHEGTVLGIKVQPFRKTYKLEPFGNVNVFRSLTEGETSAVEKALVSFSGYVRRTGLILGYPIDIEIRPNSGRMAGYYKRISDPLIPNVLCICPPTIEKLPYYISHEFGHHLWGEGMTDEQREYWIRLFGQSVKTFQISDQELDSLRERFSASRLSIPDFFKQEAKQADVPLLKEIVKYIGKHHHLQPIHINILNRSGGNVSRIWPRAVDLTEETAIVSKYALKNPEELWAEAYAYKLTGQPLAETIARAVTNTISGILKNIRSGVPASDEEAESEAA